ncbi:hypothetical protein VTJ49DRAFT_3011 [Mycothermus thermophilus]|uniref:Uncharacterized protein n=1 Tax=Humicola insolens TaxID=85995 RepID=A0ABR3V8V1_HUMIN
MMAIIQALATITVVLATIVSCREVPVNKRLRAEMYGPGLVHERIMATKHRIWGEFLRQGAFNSSQYGSFGPKKDVVQCRHGFAALVPGDPKNTFRCKNLDLYDFKTHAQLGSASGMGASIWGWTSPEGREFVAIAQEDGTAFAEVTRRGKLVYLGRLPQYGTAPKSMWREIKGYKNYVLIGSEAVRHGIQIFDMSKLLNVNPQKPVKFTNDKDLTGWWMEGLPMGKSHNVLANEELNYGVATGFQPRDWSLKAGMVFFDLTDPSNPTMLGGTGVDGYVHDAQCIVYRGPDKKYYGRDICYGYDEDAFTIFDVTDKKNITIISSVSYEGFAYIHQGWVLDPMWQQYLITDDEYDEYNRTGLGHDGYPVSYIWDISSLENPKQTGYYKGLRKGIDHNQYVKDGYTYQSNYGLGLSILDLRSVPMDPTGRSIREVAYFDTRPEDDDLPGGGNLTFTGSWANYPYFNSGYILVNTLDRGVFVLKRTR